MTNCKVVFRTTSKPTGWQSPNKGDDRQWRQQQKEQEERIQ